MLTTVEFLCQFTFHLPRKDCHRFVIFGILQFFQSIRDAVTVDYNVIRTWKQDFETGDRIEDHDQV